ncbi:PREDICTED: taste receptor type 2 member 39-like [Nanorana parkeri]|uniref:taste receptor type 2 member 39-like n=1 Tax=Nanorana parkeri TaxID=125878 RepID=UPI000854156E|nr:PREDICTED: taste receptor type 2 member 39-like [Nanorana parkeri]
MMNVTFRLTLHVTFLVLGLTGNLYILVVNALDWRKTQHLSACTTIISSLGISNLVLQAAVVINEMCFLILQSFYSQDSVINAFGTILVFTFFSSILFSVCLCFYYFVKIVPFQFLLGNLKSKISKIIPWLLGGSVLFSLIASVPLHWDLYRDTKHANISSGNVIESFNFSFASKCQCIFNIYLVLTAIVFVTYLLLCLPIIISLCKHMQMIKRNLGGTTNLDAHLSAAATLILLLALYIYLSVALSFVFNLTKTAGTWFFSFCFLMISSFPSLNSLVLIIGNPKLRKPLKKLCITNCCHRDDT